MPQATFTVTYDGPALDSGDIPVRDLAPALLALGELFVEASSVVAPDHEPASLSIRATETGSFSVHLALTIPDVVDRLTDVMTSDPATALVNLQGIILTGAGLFSLIRRIKNREIKDTEPGPEPGLVRITLDDGTVIEARGQALELYIERSARKNARAVTKPLEEPGIERLELTSATHSDPVVIDADDVGAFHLPDVPDVKVAENDVEMLVEIAAPAFPSNHKWRLSNGTGSFWATIGDTTFLDHINAGEPFRKGDMLRCQFRVTQYERPDGLHTEHHITKVLAHIDRGEQLRIDGT